MRTLLCVLATSAVAGLAPSVASAADFGGYVEEDTVIERPAPVVEHERIIERRYYEPADDYYDDAPEVTYYEAPYPVPYPRFRHRHWRHDGRW
ncbi:MAG TPA: hypothetical protein VM620_15850 [Hyphomicrobium sp.]|jgi:hypothetical protein|nr:hypothetical protein [Hyphomicrobium sp.]